MIVWLASYPRSGNTFFRVLLKELYGIHTISKYVIGKPISTEPADHVFQLVQNTMTSLDQLAASPAQHVVKTHDLPNDSYPAIYLVRDGRDALVSHAHFHLKYDLKLSDAEHNARFERTLKMLIETDVSFGGWSGNVQAWTKRAAPTVIVKFEDLIRNPEHEISRALAGVGVQFGEAYEVKVSTFGELQEKMPDFFRKGKAGSWREEMPPQLQKSFWKRHRRTMQLLGYD